MFGPLGATRDLMREGQRRAVVRQIMLKDKRLDSHSRKLSKNV